MGRLRWREKGSRLGCRRGWFGILGLVAFVLAGYFALYGWLRATGKIYLASFNLVNFDSPNETRFYQVDARFENGTIPIYAIGISSNIVISSKAIFIGGPWNGGGPRSMTMKAMWPAVKLEIALDRRGWSPLDRFIARTGTLIPNVQTSDSEPVNGL